jgi:hypothetical protein
MHVVLIEVDLDEGADQKYLREQVVPTVQELPGFRSGVWLNGQDTGTGLSLTIWDKDFQADAMMERFGKSGPEAGGTVRRCQVHKVAASAFCFFSPGAP